MVTKKNILKYLFATITLSIVFGGSITLGYIANLVKDQPLLTYEEMKENIDNISKNSEVYFSNGEKVATINYELMRKTIPLEDMGDNIKNAIIASEDSNFYNNIGIDLIGIIRAAINEVTKNSSTGGSTITQQLVKNQLLDSSRSYERKAKEILLAVRVNKYFTKDEVLEAYLNMAPFGKNKLGQNISGIETAATGIFGISAKDLNIAQAAYLAGFVQSPFKYTPFKNNGELKNDDEIQSSFIRQKYVLNRMLTKKYINKEQYEEALKFDVKNSFVKELYDDRGHYPYIINEVIQSSSEIIAKQAAQKNGELDKFENDADFKNDLLEKSRIKFVTNGYKVKTTLIKDLYDKIDKAKNNYSGFISKNIKGKNETLQIGATLIENETGKILVFIGGKDYNTQQLNHATRTYRSPGSTIKPLLVYAPAIDKGYITPNSILLDKRFNYQGWKPENFTKFEYGVLSAKNALAKSLNLATIRLYSAFYLDDPVKEYLEKMNFKAITPADHHTLAASIGGLAYGFTVTENTNAFSTLANDGKFQQAYIIDEILDNNNNIIYKANFKPIQIYKKETSYIITNMLHEVITSNGTAPDIAAALKFNNRNLFVKTGTSEFNHDLWTIGGSKKITFGLWTGYDTPSEISGYNHAHIQWAYFMNIINEYDPKIISADTPFIKPDSITIKGINTFNNSSGYTLDLVPNNFVPLDKNKVIKKFGGNIDKNSMFIFEKITKKDDDYKKDKDEKNEAKSENIKPNESNNNSNTTETTTPTIKPETIIVEDNQDN